MSMEAIKEAFGAEPVQHSDGTYSPSVASTKVAVPTTSGYHPITHEAPYAGDKRILVLCTQDADLTCTNGRVFQSGNHPVELFVVVLHLEAAGFTVDLATPTGKPVRLEEWAIPHGDDVITKAIAAHQHQLDHPLSLEAVAANLLDDSPYLSAYLPGGHGALLGLPQSKAAGTILRWFIDRQRPLVAICHGPAVLLALSLDGAADDFPLACYEIVCFTHQGDALMTKVGYLPGDLPYLFDEKLAKLGMVIVNTIPDGSTHVDRILITGDSPAAGDKLGKLAAKELLEFARSRG